MLKQLYKSDLQILAQTCCTLRLLVLGPGEEDVTTNATVWPLRGIIHSRSLLRGFEYEGCMEVYLRFTRDRIGVRGLDSYDCRDCSGKHFVQLVDIPDMALYAARKDLIDCPSRRDNWDFHVRASHVDIALRYIDNWTVIGPIRQDYVRCIVLAYMHETFLDREARSRYSRFVHSNSVAVRPKVVLSSSPDGAGKRRPCFLLKTVRRLRFTNILGIDRFRACAHCHFSGTEYRAMRARGGCENSNSHVLFDLVAQVREASTSDPMRRSCSECRTDFEAIFHPHTQIVTLRTWHHLGREDPSVKLASKTGGSDEVVSDDVPDDAPKRHKPGEAMRMYLHDPEVPGLTESRSGLPHGLSYGSAIWD